MINISCCINTFKRPELLKKTLISLNEQELINNKVSLEIIVVDNDPLRLGEKVIEELKPKFKYPIKYFVQPIKNISITRNKAVSEANGEYILFIDDDGYADKRWVRNMVDCAIKYNAAAVFGRVIPYFSENAPKWIKDGKFFERECEQSGENPKYTRTTNCLIKTNLLKSIPGPFDPQYGLTGGSDSHLFSIISKKGAKFISCYEGIVYDYVHPSRANFYWLLQRSFRTGNTYTRRVLEFSNNNLIIRVYLLVKAMVYSFISVGLICFHILSKKKRIYWALKLGGNIGHIMATFKFHYFEYK